MEVELRGGRERERPSLSEKREREEWEREERERGEGESEMDLGWKEGPLMLHAYTARRAALKGGCIGN